MREREKGEEEREKQKHRRLSFFSSFLIFEIQKHFLQKKRGGKKKEKTKRLKNIPFSRREGDEDQEEEIIFDKKEQNFVFFGLEGQERSHRLLKGTC